MSIKVFFIFFLSFVICWILIKNLFGISKRIYDADFSLPQKFHQKPTPRGGGIAIFFSFLWASLYYLRIETFALTSFFVWITGLFEDINQKTSPHIRLIAQIISAIIAIIMVKALVINTGYFKLPLFIAVPFTIFCIVGVTNAFNIIDGFNGLASGTAIFSLLTMAMVSYKVRDYLMLYTIIFFVAAILGYFIWNFPKGKIFLGDNGAYLLGFLIAVFSIMLVHRNVQVSPWFPLTVVIYPVWEVVFSIYRRKKKKFPPVKSDKLHLHSLIYKRITRNNPLTSVFLWILNLPFWAAALLFYKNTYILTIVCIIFILTYTYIYKNIIKFKTPKVCRTLFDLIFKAA